MVNTTNSYMEQPVSVVVAEITMQHVEELVLATCRQTISLWLRYVDDTFTGVHKDEIGAFHDHLDEQNADIQFTKEIEDFLVSRDNNELRTTVCRKPTYTDSLLDESSYKPTSHKATTIKTLTRRGQLVCDTPDGLRDENKYLERVFITNHLAQKRKYSLTLDYFSLSSQQRVPNYILYLCTCLDVHLWGILAQFWPNKHFSRSAAIFFINS